MRFFTLLFLGVCLFACGSNQQAEADDSAEGDRPAEVQNNDASAVGNQLYPSLPIDRLEYLWNNSTYMDVVFYQIPVSLNQSTQEQIRSTLMGVGEEVPAIDPNCQSVGRIFFQVGGENVEAAEIFFQAGCTYYLWLEDEQPAYANAMTEQAIGFYNNIFQQVQSATQGGGQ